jgi:hypothetical protein
MRAQKPATDRWLWTQLGKVKKNGHGAKTMRSFWEGYMRSHSVDSVLGNRTHALRLSTAIAALAILSACGGGGASGSPGQSAGGGATTETINGIAVPPTPDPAANRATVAGVDSNGNGVRDDVDRLLATEFGQSPATHQDAVLYARTQQAALSTPTSETTEGHIALLRCVRDPQRLAELKKITVATLDVPIRRRAYASAFAGVVLSRRGCP